MKRGRLRDARHGVLKKLSEPGFGRIKRLTGLEHGLLKKFTRKTGQRTTVIEQRFAAVNRQLSSVN